MNQLEKIFHTDIDAHVGRITDELAEYGIARAELAELDHLCYRVEMLDRYEEMKRELARVAVKRAETDVQGRPIAIFELREYIDARGWTIPYIELPAPKEGSPYAEGLEHAEFVVIGNLEQFRERHGAIVFDTDAMNRPINPELGLKNERAAMKFHKLQIGAVVDIEQVMREMM